MQRRVEAGVARVAGLATPLPEAARPDGCVLHRNLAAGHSSRPMSAGALPSGRQTRFPGLAHVGAHLAAAAAILRFGLLASAGPRGRRQVTAQHPR